ncbi:MAG: hypothetical protein EGR08_04925 [Prevotella sp.]|nr:hypothetical protein [Prevotella sp.]
MQTIAFHFLFRYFFLHKKAKVACFLQRHVFITLLQKFCFGMELSEERLIFVTIGVERTMREAFL